LEDFFMRKIGSLKLDGEAFLAPMADYTNIAFRTLCRENGAALCYTELISAKALLMKSKKTEKMLAVSEKEKPVFLQLFGREPKDFGRAVELVEKKFGENFAGYDLNCGCSVPKAQKAKYGCALMNDAHNVGPSKSDAFTRPSKPGALIGQIVRSMKNETSKPITIKMRLGVSSETFIEVAREAEKKGASAITLHPRFGEQGYAGTANWSKIKELKESISIPIIGNGDIKSPEDVLRMKKETNCDFEMIGRSVMGNAFFFTQTNELLAGRIVPDRTKKIAWKEAQRFFELVREFSLGVNDARPYFIAFAKGFSGASEMRNRFARSKTIEELESVLFSFQ
jgi:nifR3 family TIM-barrel protein